MIQFQHHRGGDVVLSTINAPATQQWMSPAFSIDFALALEQRNRRVCIYKSINYILIGSNLSTIFRL